METKKQDNTPRITHLFCIFLPPYVGYFIHIRWRPNHVLDESHYISNRYSIWYYWYTVCMFIARRSMNREKKFGIGEKNQTLDSIHKMGGMRIKSGLGSAFGVFLFLMLTSGAQTETQNFDRADFMNITAPNIFSDEIAERRRCRVIGASSGVRAPFKILTLGNLKRREIAEAPISGSDIYKFQGGLSIFSAHETFKAGANSFFSLSQIMESDEPIPTVALLVLVGLVALIALKGRRK